MATESRWDVDVAGPGTESLWDVDVAGPGTRSVWDFVSDIIKIDQMARILPTRWRAAVQPSRWLAKIRRG